MAKTPVNPVDRSVGAKISARRSALGLSQTDLGNAVGVSFQQIQKYERGTNRVSASRIQQVAAALQVQPMFFFDDQSPLPKGVDDASVETLQFCLSPEGLRLIRAFSHVGRKGLRTSIVRLLERLAAKSE